ncbi:MAG: hypothetical protein H0T69_09615 [Thermoleophilaceae bacterium]|nr:hypothetical protein [Thermoleophilaceae bacterium]
MSDQEQLQWEARYGRPAAIAAFAAGFLLLAGTFALQSIFEDRPRVEALPDFLLSAHDSPETLILSSALQAASALCLIAVFYYLFRAIIHRSPQVPKWFVYLILAGPVFYAVSQVVGAIDRVDVADTFAARSSDAGKFCPAIFGNRGDECAQDLLSDDVSPILVGLSLAGSVATAFLFVMLPLRARRAGLMSQFMAILGVIAGALMVLRLVPLVPEIVQAFWLGAVGAMFLSIWPGGRGPAWETGLSDPWPSSAERRGLVTAGAGSDNGGGGSSAEPAGTPPEPEPNPQRPSSRKRRRKRR